ncbi:MAG: hypothetical protein HYS25_15280 [Ignavibacteriales bacterium]|nr:hypothetical protein [Ignavibacteriales bacterium]
MNKKQKVILLVAATVVILSLIVWQIYGGEIFTKTQVLVETKDELFGWTEKKWEDKFIWGLDLSLMISGASVFIGSVLLFVFRNKRIE